MEMGSIVQFFEDKTLLVTGGTGSLAKIMVEKILRVISTELFRVVREKCGPSFSSHILEKVIPVPGDVACEDLRIEESDLRTEMWRQIDVIVHSAATTNFDERYDVAMGINVMGAMNVLNFAKKCTNLKMLLHVSTAYVCGEREGLILERPINIGETLNGTSSLDIDAERKLVEEKLNDLQAQNATEKEVKIAMKNLGTRRALHHGWPNTYSFTKAMGEMLLGHFKENVPLIVMRPTIIISTYKEPFPGWIEGLRTVDSFILACGKGKMRHLLFDPDSISDMIPGDMVVNAMMVAIVVNANQPSDKIMIYHVGSSLRNPLRYDTIRDCGIRYFTKNPWIDKAGKSVNMGKIRVFSTMASFHKYVTIRYLLPLKVFKFLSVALCCYPQETYMTLHRKINFLIRLVELYRPYLFFKGTFEDSNTERLRMAAEREGRVEEGAFYFDPKCIDWEDNFTNTHFPGVVKYLF